MTDFLEGYVRRVEWRNAITPQAADVPREKLGFFDRIAGSLDVEQILVLVRGLPSELEGFRIACVADTHGGFALSRDVYDALAAARPDAICILGDMIDSSTKSLDRLAPFLRAIATLAPTAAIFGNNDYASGILPSLAKELNIAGIALLEDESIYIRRGGAAVRLVGVQDRNAQRMRVAKVRSESDESAERMFLHCGKPYESRVLNVLMIHRPLKARRFLENGFSLALSGHAHGGQIRVFGRGLYAPNEGILPRVTSGLYQMGGGQLVVSRGLGNHEIPLRLNNRSHLPIVTILKG